MTVEDLLERLDGVRAERDGQWAARCPAHEDRHASLAISEGEDGRILLYCFAGCHVSAVCAELNVSERDLFAEERALVGANGNGAPPRTPAWGARPLARAVLPFEGELRAATDRLYADEDAKRAVWEEKGWRALDLAALGVGLIGNRLSIPIRDADGRLVNLLRYWPGASPKSIATRGCPRLPLTLLHDEGPVWVVEGEGDALSVAMLGMAVIGAPGAASRPKAEWLDAVRGRDVIVCFDNDEPGEKAARKWAWVVAGRGPASVRILQLDGPEGFDVGDLVRDGRENPPGVRRALLAAAQNAPLYVPEDDPEGKPRARISRPLRAPPASAGGLFMRPLSGVTLEPVDWLWRERIPRGRVGLLFGAPGYGKSTLTTFLSAEITQRGGRVLVASAEDNAETALAPRMLAAGADLSLVELLVRGEKVGESGLLLPRDMQQLGERMEGADLLIVDPLSAHLDETVNSWSEQDVRSQVVAPLVWHSARTGCAVVFIMHLNKSDRGDALSRINGSGGFGGGARFALLLGPHPDDLSLDPDDRRVVLVHVKASEGRLQRAMVFRRSIATLALADGRSTTVPLLDVVTDQARIEPELILASTDPEEASAFSEAQEWLKRELADGPKLAKRLSASARERGDFSDRTLRRAKRSLGVRSERSDEGWIWVYDPLESRR